MCVSAGWLYLAVVIDARGKRVLGRTFPSSLETAFVILALLMAIRKRGGRCAPGLLLQSDRGVQHASERFRAVFEWIDAFYNLRRRLSSTGHLPPVDFENQRN